MLASEPGSGAGGGSGGCAMIKCYNIVNLGKIDVKGGKGGSRLVDGEVDMSVKPGEDMEMMEVLLSLLNMKINSLLVNLNNII
jgi:hypothetical protein